jgi:HAE1 family hydrophobic/amphiphilic exporter-1
VTFILEDKTGGNLLAPNLPKFMAAASKRPELASVFTTALLSVPQIYVDVNRDQALQQGVELANIYSTMQCFMGGAFVNYYNQFGRQWQVYVQAEGDFRTRIENLGMFYVLNRNGNKVPLEALTSVRRIEGPEFTMRFNLHEAAQINASPAPGVSTAQAMKALEEVFEETMPQGMGYNYMGMSYQEKKAQQGVSPLAIFGFSLLCVFLILAAQYESWSLPFSVLMCTPIAVAGAFAGILVGRYENNVYAQIGLVMLIGLSAKNAILIVEFAKMGYEEGKSLAEASLESARLRLRPILMTSFAFILGCVPLATASGAGALSRQVMGFTVIGGMLTASFVAIFLIPVAFYLVEKLSSGGHGKNTAPPTTNPVKAHG